MTTFGQLLKDGRQRAGLTQHQLAERVGVRQQAVNRWESDRDVPRRETIRELARELRLSAGQLAAALGFVDEEPESQVIQVRHMPNDGSVPLQDNVIVLPPGVRLTEAKKEAVRRLFEVLLVDEDREPRPQ